MAKQLKGLVTVISVAMLIYLVSSGNSLVAGDTEDEAEEEFAGATISVEASLVAVEFEVLEEIIDEPDIKSLNSIPLEKIMQCVREEEGEVISIVKLAVSNKSTGEMSREESVKEQRKVSNEDVSENKERENHVSFRVNPEIIDITRIEVSFDFKQIVLEGTLSAVQEVEEQGEKDIVIEISSEVVLRPGQPRIVGATRREEAIFLIMDVDI